MINPEEIFIRQEQEFQKCLDSVNQVFYLDRDLPEQVFCENYTGFLVDENVGFCSDFWEGLHHSKLNTGDELLTVISLEPRIFNNHYSLFGYYGAFQLSINSSQDDFYKMLTYDSISKTNNHIGDFRYSTTIICIPESLEWAVWQSDSFEATIIAFNKNTETPKIPFCPNWWPVHNNWMSAEKAIMDVMPVMFREGEVPERIATPFLKNYGGQGYENRL
jgi:hypothetical protein